MLDFSFSIRDSGDETWSVVFLIAIDLVHASLAQANMAQTNSGDFFSY